MRIWSAHPTGRFAPVAGLFTAMLLGGLFMPCHAQEPTCLVLAEGYVSEYAWARYQEAQFPLHHPGYDFLIRGLTQHADRFTRWLSGWRVRRVDLERLEGPLNLAGVDLVILDDVRQCVCDPHEPTLVEYVRGGGGLVFYAGRWGLGGCPKTEYSVPEEVSSYESTPLGAILPVEITATPDLEMLTGASAEAQRPEFLDPGLGEGIDTGGWLLLGLHACAPRGEVLATLDQRPLICEGTWGEGRLIVYTGDDLAWVRAGKQSHVNPYAGTLWRRLAALASGGEVTRITATPDLAPAWERTAAFAHPEQPMNFQWGGYFAHRDDLMDSLWARDLVTHSATSYYGAPEPLGKAGIEGWLSSGPPLRAPASLEDPKTWMVDAAGRPIDKSPCFSNPQALGNMAQRMGEWAAEAGDSDWVTYGHMGDETEYPLCFCEHCRTAFREQTGHELPELKDDFSDEYLDRWIEFQMFRNRAIGQMYRRAARAARAANPRLRMFASLPITGGMCHGDDQYHTQSGFDLLWDHTYPGTMAIRVGLNAQLLEETAQLQGRPGAPILNLLQGFDSYDRVPNMPPAPYMREMVWQAVAHGIDSVGWFVYNAFFWNLPGTEAWEECGRLAHDLLEPMTPTLYEMENSPQPVGLLYSYSQEAVDGLRGATWGDDEPWKGVIRWWAHHATQEAYEVLKYAHVPCGVVSEYRLYEGRDLPYRALVIPYAEHLHARTREALERFIAGGGKVYVGANCSLELSGAAKLPVSFDTKFTTWWPKERRDEWNQRRVRQYLIGPFLEKARRLRGVLSEFTAQSPIAIDDPEVVWSLRQAGEATYLFCINDHQINPTSPELRRKRQGYNHFMLMPMEFPPAEAELTVRQPGYLYRLPNAPGEPIQLEAQGTKLPLSLDGGDGAVFLLLPQRITGVRLLAAPSRTPTGVQVEAHVTTEAGVLQGAVPLRIELEAGGVRQTVYATTRDGVLDWEAPFLKQFPEGEVTVTVTDLASGMMATATTRAAG